MGYLTDKSGRLVCDRCAKTGGVRKRKCPFGYCPPPAFCGDCYKRDKFRDRAAHVAAGCEKKSLAFQADLKRRNELMAEGTPVRCAALNAATSEDPDRIHVLFREKDATVGRYMPKAVYRAHPIGVTVTLADYEATHGGILPDAPESF